MRSLALHKMRSDYGVGVSPQRRNLDTILFPESVGVKENRQILLCKRSGGNPEIREIKKSRRGGSRYEKTLAEPQCRGPSGRPQELFTRRVGLLGRSWLETSRHCKRTVQFFVACLRTSYPRASGHLPRTEPGSEGTIWQCADSIWLE
jgi:hypothetical protein